MGDFKHIRFTAADEDDEVIVAGTGALADGLPAAGMPTDDVRVRETPAGKAGRGEAPHDGPGNAGVPHAGAPHGRPEEAADAVRATTLSDLDPEPMPFAQKAVIIAAVICIIGALAYYLIAMR